MATNTTNYNLVKPAYADTADIADINGNMDIIDGQMKTNADGVSANATSLAKSQSGLAYIVGNTNTTGSTLAADTYVYVKGHSSIAEGLRRVTASISNNGSITTSNTSAVSNGGINSLNSKIYNMTYAHYVEDANDATDPSQCYYTDTSSLNAPTSSWYLIKPLSKSSDYCVQMASTMNSLSGVVFIRTKTSAEWGNWQKLVAESAAPEIVSNANGTAYKFPSGFMICTKKVSDTIAMTTAWGSLFIGTCNLGSWPVEFTGVPTMNVTNLSANSAIPESFATQPTKSSAGTIELCRATSATYPINLHIVAYGLWK